ncbi:MAG: conjugal transfer protein TrbN [Gammaproteobacteria bacterium RIFCSPHIGHO2_12_FULL_35_23]|nr:MAG: conjugal transfer protein TrbN [Gammaproteobacteria bacterium RIFCSPHIGHO2_12_FULL_35_23]
MVALIINDVPIECIMQAARQYYLPVALVISVLKAENGAVGEANVNKNGTIDYGPMQINSVWLKQIEPYGYTVQDLQYNPCVNVQVGAWILAQQVANGSSLWQGVGDYHSHSYYQNQLYSSRVSQYYYYLMKALSGRD